MLSGRFAAPFVAVLNQRRVTDDIEDRQYKKVYLKSGNQYLYLNGVPDYEGILTIHCTPLHAEAVWSMQVFISDKSPRSMRKSSPHCLIKRIILRFSTYGRSKLVGHPCASFLENNLGRERAQIYDRLAGRWGWRPYHLSLVAMIAGVENVYHVSLN